MSRKETDLAHPEKASACTHEPNFTEIKANEHFETGSEFRFRVQGALAAEPRLHYMIWDGDSEEPLTTGPSGQFDYAFPTGQVGRWNVYFWSDTVENGKLDAEELEVTSQSFVVKNLPPANVIDMVYSSCLHGDPAAQAAAMLDAGSAALLRKDSEDDWRAIVKFVAGAADEFMVAACAVPAVGVQPPVPANVDEWIDPVVW